MAKLVPVTAPYEAQDYVNIWRIQAADDGEGWFFSSQIKDQFRRKFSYDSKYFAWEQAPVESSFAPKGSEAESSYNIYLLNLETKAITLIDRGSDIVWSHSENKFWYMDTANNVGALSDIKSYDVETQTFVTHTTGRPVRVLSDIDNDDMWIYGINTSVSPREAKRIKVGDDNTIELLPQMDGAVWMAAPPTKGVDRLLVRGSTTSNNVIQWFTQSDPPTYIADIDQQIGGGHASIIGTGTDTWATWDANAMRRWDQDENDPITQNFEINPDPIVNNGRFTSTSHQSLSYPLSTSNDMSSVKVNDWNTKKIRFKLGGLCPCMWGVKTPASPNPLGEPLANLFQQWEWDHPISPDGRWMVMITNHDLAFPRCYLAPGSTSTTMNVAPALGKTEATADFPSSGLLVVATTATPEIIRYTSKTASTFELQDRDVGNLRSGDAAAGSPLNLPGDAQLGVPVTLPSNYLLTPDEATARDDFDKEFSFWTNGAGKPRVVDHERVRSFSAPEITGYSPNRPLLAIRRAQLFLVELPEIMSPFIDEEWTASYRSTEWTIRKRSTTWTPEPQ